MKRGNQGQMKMSFGMIFSIILIILFIAFAFYGISKFLGFQESVSVEKFVSDLQLDVDRIWKGSQASIDVTYPVPSKISRVCFHRGRAENFVIYYEQLTDGRKINNLDIDKITESENPYCIEVEDRKVKMHLEKDFGESLVTISMQE